MHGRRGQVVVSLAEVELTAPDVQRDPRVALGRWVRLSVRDDGVGMDEATQGRIFEPFFTARASGTGTGLGLSVVQSIVEAHEGHITLESQPGVGTTFSVYLPPVAAQPEQPGVGRHLMLVDDHPGMARVSARLLETFGFQTSVFDDPRVALERFKESPERFDVVLTDLSMPQMSGEAFIAALRAVRQAVPIIVSSGLANELDEAGRRRLGVDGVLVKPWRLEEAIALLERLLPTRAS
jgi:CheY-like chemotaxis protein